MTSRYTNDPRVTDMGGLWEISTFGHHYGTVIQKDGGYVALADRQPEDQAQTFPTLDDAIRSLAGGPQAPPAPGEALRELENM